MQLDAIAMGQPAAGVGAARGGRRRGRLRRPLVHRGGPRPVHGCTAAALGAPGLTLGTAVALAFPRSPMVTAQAAWELADLTQGRFVLGLGTQVKAHIERRYGVAYDHPGLAPSRVRPGGAGDLRRLPARGAPGLPRPVLVPRPAPRHVEPRAHRPPDVPIYVAAVRPWMAHMAGEVADGIHVHPFHSRRYLEDVVLPSLRGRHRGRRTGPGDGRGGLPGDGDRGRHRCRARGRRARSCGCGSRSTARPAPTAASSTATAGRAPATGCTSSKPPATSPAWRPPSPTRCSTCTRSPRRGTSSPGCSSSPLRRRRRPGRHVRRDVGLDAGRSHPRPLAGRRGGGRGRAAPVRPGPARVGTRPDASTTPYGAGVRQPDPDSVRTRSVERALQPSFERSSEQVAQIIARRGGPHPRDRDPRPARHRRHRRGRRLEPGLLPPLQRQDRAADGRPRGREPPVHAAPRASHGRVRHAAGGGGVLDPRHAGPGPERQPGHRHPAVPPQRDAPRLRVPRGVAGRRRDAPRPAAGRARRGRRGGRRGGARRGARPLEHRPADPRADDLEPDPARAAPERRRRRGGRLRLGRAAPRDPLDEPPPREKLFLACENRVPQRGGIGTSNGGTTCGGAEGSGWSGRWWC